jgi:hypothetical protein
MEARTLGERTLNITPQQVRRWGWRTFAISGPVAVAIMAAWGFRLLLPERPNLVLMMYLLSLIAAGAGILAAATASCHMAIARAFSAGLHANRSAGPWPAVDRPQPQALRLVE